MGEELKQLTDEDLATPKTTSYNQRNQIEKKKEKILLSEDNSKMQMIVSPYKIEGHPPNKE
jgi:hypothetical protein